MEKIFKQELKNIYFKLIISFLVDKCDGYYTKLFIDDLTSRIDNRIQLITDGHKAYLEAIKNAFASNIDYAMLVKLYGNSPEFKQEHRYNPAVCTARDTKIISGNPDSNHISTSYIERQNLTMRCAPFHGL